MKKRILIIIGFISFGFSTLYGQCTPDPLNTIVGFYPDSITGLEDAQIGITYNEVVTIITPIDTTIELIPGAPQTLPFDSLVITNVSGLPPGYSFSCGVINCAFPGGIPSCFSINGTSAISDVGSYPILIEYNLYIVTAAPIPKTNDDYIINVVNTVGVNSLNSRSFELKQNIPNPANQSTSIKFNTNEFGDYSFQVINSLGKIVYREKINVSKTENSIELDLNNYYHGLYFYSLSNKKQHFTMKMIVN